MQVITIRAAWIKSSIHVDMNGDIQHVRIVVECFLDTITLSLHVSLMSTTVDSHCYRGEHPYRGQHSVDFSSCDDRPPVHN